MIPFYADWAHESRGLLSRPCGCIRLTGGSLDRDAILDASSLPDPSNLQSENVQEGWNWTANSYQKRSSGDSDLSRHWTMTTRFDRYPRTVRRLPCEPADRAGWRQAFGMLSDHGRRLPSLQDNLAWPYANTLVPHSRRHSRFGKLAPARLVTLTECTLSFISYVRVASPDQASIRRCGGAVEGDANRCRQIPAMDRQCRTTSSDQPARAYGNRDARASESDR